MIIKQVPLFVKEAVRLLFPFVQLPGGCHGIAAVAPADLLQCPIQLFMLFVLLIAFKVQVKEVQLYRFSFL